VSEFEFFGETFRLRPSEECEMAILDFAEHVSGKDPDSESLAGLAVVKTFLRDCVAEDDWDRFWRHARANRAQVKRDLMPVVGKVFFGGTDRPTERPSDSSAGPADTAANSEPDSSSPVTELPPVPRRLTPVQRQEALGRPDRAWVLQQAAEEEARASLVSA